MASGLDLDDMAILVRSLSPETVDEGTAAFKRLIEQAWVKGWEACAASERDILADHYTADELLTIAAQSGMEIERA